MPRSHRGVAVERRIPRWAAGLLERLAQDRPTVLTRSDVAAYLVDVGSERGVDATVPDLVRLGWLASSHTQGVWLYVPPGESAGIDPYIEIGAWRSRDPYIDLRAWRARDPDVVFALAGEAAAWHLGYLDRRFDGPTTVWLPNRVRPPFGVRPFVSVLRLGWGRDAATRVGPTRALLRRRRLDLTGWATGLPAFGPEALLVQLAARPGSFTPWADLIVHLGDLADDCEPGRLVELLERQSLSAWQRAAYLLHCGGAASHADDVFAGRPRSPLVHAALGDGPDRRYSSQFGVTDRLVAPLLGQLGKA